MYQFFVEDEQIANDLVIIEGSDVNHIRNVLRMKCGEKVRISSTSGRNFFGTIDRIAENVVEVCITEETALDTELPCRICLFQGLPKSDKMELIVQKAVELGAAEVIPVAMKNCVVKLDAKKAAAKTARWQEIAKSAAKQFLPAGEGTYSSEHCSGFSHWRENSTWCCCRMRMSAAWRPQGK